MCAIYLKDLYECRKTWLAFAAVELAGVAAILWGKLPPDRIDILRGFVQGLVIAAGVIFAYQVVVTERKRRHLVLLRSLPLNDWEIVLAKFAATLTLSLSLAGILGLTLSSSAYGFSPGSFALLISTMILYSTLLLFFATAFENQAYVLVPFYLAVLVMLLLDSDLGSLKLSFSLQDWIPAAIATSLLLSALFLSLTMAVIRSKELDL